MKKRKVKDFIALYAPEDEEKLVLIQSGTIPAGPKDRQRGKCRLLGFLNQHPLKRLLRELTAACA